MLNNDNQAWLPFSIMGKTGLFEMKATSSGVDSIKLKQGKNCVLPYISRSANNNGINRFADESNSLFNVDKGNCVTIGLDTQTAFYHKYDFITGQNVHILTGDVLTEELAPFVITMLTFQMKSRFNWGGNGATLGRLKHTKIMLPATDEGQPDYQYMEQNVIDKQKALLARYKQYIERKIEELSYKEVPTLDEVEWKKFNFKDIFKICNGFYNKKPNSDGTGTIPFIGAVDSNNGVTRFLTLKEIEENSKTGKLPNEPLERKIFHCGAICVTNNGSVGHAYYEPNQFTCSHDVTPLYLLNYELTTALAMFIINSIEKQGVLFQYAKKWRPCRMINSKIMLPINASGEPDYEYMEQYAKNIMYKKYKQYLTYFEKKYGDRL